jgi:DNA-binding MurR/RpiR family transcriptional regulator
MSKSNQDKISFPPYMKTGIKDIAEKLGVSRASFVRMCVKKELDERGYKKTIKP